MLMVTAQQCVIDIARVTNGHFEIYGHMRAMFEIGGWAGLSSSLLSWQ